MKIPFGLHFVINSDDHEEWGKAIKNVCCKERSSRLQECEILCVLHQQKYSWKEQSESLVSKMTSLTEGMNYFFRYFCRYLIIFRSMKYCMCYISKSIVGRNRVNLLLVK